MYKLEREHNSWTTVKVKSQTDEKYTSEKRQLESTIKELTKLKQCQFELSKTTEQLNVITREKLRLEQELAGAKSATVKAEIMSRDIEALQESIKEGKNLILFLTYNLNSWTRTSSIGRALDQI